MGRISNVIPLFAWLQDVTRDVHPVRMYVESGLPLSFAKVMSSGCGS